MKLNEKADILEDRIRIQNGIDKLEKLSEINLMKFCNKKGTVLHLGKNDEMHKHKLGND